MARFTRTVAAGAGDQISVSGTSIRMVESTGLITILPSNRNEGRLMQGGDIWTLNDRVIDPTFKALQINNETDDSITFTIEVYSVDSDNFQADGTNVVVGTHPVTQSGVWDVWGNSPTTNSDGSVSVSTSSTLIVAANALNRVVSIQPVGGVIHVRKGAAASTTLGVKVADGQLYECTTTQAIYGISPVGTIVTYHDSTRI
jgi:hypothetical protein